MKMMMMLLLVSAVALLATTAFPSNRDPNLDEMLDLAGKHNASFSTEDFVEDVEPLVGQGCEVKFFCKVHDLLHNHTNFNKAQEIKILGNLKQHIKNKTCKEVKPAGSQITISKSQITIAKLMEHLITCIRQTNFRAGKTTIGPATQ